MTRKEVSELFALWALNWPNAEMFKGGADMIDARVKLFASALHDVDFWIGQRATAYAFSTREYAPNIAEFLNDVDAVTLEIENEIHAAYLQLRNAVNLSKMSGFENAGLLELLSPRTKKVISAMGGMEAFIQSEKSTYNLQGFEQTYWDLMHTNQPMLLTKGTERI